VSGGDELLFGLIGGGSGQAAEQCRELPLSVFHRDLMGELVHIERDFEAPLHEASEHDSTISQRLSRRDRVLTRQGGSQEHFLVTDRKDGASATISRVRRRKDPVCGNEELERGNFRQN
jgi:hypothetical protein